MLEPVGVTFMVTLIYVGVTLVVTLLKGQGRALPLHWEKLLGLLNPYAYTDV